MVSRSGQKIPAPPGVSAKFYIYHKSGYLTYLKLQDSYVFMTINLIGIGSAAPANTPRAYAISDREALACDGEESDFDCGISF